MATRARDWGDVGGVSMPAAPPVGPDQHVTPAAIDEALDFVARNYGLSSTVTATLRQLLSADYTSGVAQAYFSALASRGLRMSRLTALRKELSVPYALEDAQVSALTAYAPDYRLSFRGVESHDHPVYAAQRIIDQQICESRMPPGKSCTDIGGSTVHHSAVGDLGWHTCDPVVDRKDQARRVLMNLTHRKRATDERWPEETREYSRRFLAGDEAIACGKRAQDCNYKSFAATAVHVYDIPMSDWAAIMENKELQLVEGCMLFTDRLFHEPVGEFPSAGIRYECDPKRDTYSMGFVGSPSWWYTHSLREHLRYGVDQVLIGKKGVYSYKVVERRQDTIFFRILRVSGEIRPDHSQTYRLPGVEMVEVTGPEVSSAALERRNETTWKWPKPLWDAMVSAALHSLERGTFDVEQHFNKYRSIAPRQSINAVVVSGGYTVQLHDRVALVIYSALEAVIQMARQQATFVAFMDVEQRKRRFDSAGLLRRVLISLQTFTSATINYAVMPLRRVTDSWGRNVLEGLEQLYSVAPMAVIRTVPADVILWGMPLASTSDGREERDRAMRAAALEMAPTDVVQAAVTSPAVARKLLDFYGDAFPDRYRAKLESVAGESETVVGDSTKSAVDGDDVSANAYVVNSIKEAIVECELEMEHVEASCLKFSRECMAAGEPNLDVMKRKAEEMMEPDFWWISKGYVTRSALGRSIEEFDSSGLLLPVRSSAGRYVHPVTPIYWEGNSRGVKTIREYPSVMDTSFEGWAFSNKSLAIYNGPEIVTSLTMALQKVRSVKVVLHSGPAGCGKTTAIVAALGKNDVVLCPARASAEETRGRIASLRAELKFDGKMRCKTIDAYLVNWSVNEKVRALTTDVLRGDEGFMTRGGRWYGSAALLGARRIDVYGDDKQIPHVPRALCPQMFLAVRPDEVDAVWVSYRCPWDALAAVGDLYGWKARSASQVEKSLLLLASVASRPVEHGHVMLCMYQDEKKVLAKLYADVKVPIRIMTVHESQGNTFKHVRLHRFVRGKNQTRVPDAYDLFQKDAYLLVALTRHTQSFQYFTEMGDDPLTDRIEQGSLQSRVNAAGDVETAGVACEYA